MSYQIHGHQTGGKSLTYSSWSAMKQRCLNENHVSFEKYGGRGIAVCERWNRFESFLADMGERPSKKHSLERQDTNKDYEPGNCVWALPKQQANNRRNNRVLRYREKEYTVATLFDTKFPPRPDKKRMVFHLQFYRRLKRGWSVEEAFDTPLPGRGKKDTPRGAHVVPEC